MNWKEYPENLIKGRESAEATFIFCLWKQPELYDDFARVNTYDEAPINVGDIIKTIECSEEGRWSKDNNGDWQQDNSDKESILKKWSFVRDEAKEDE